jgi:hypothetical protein
MIAAHPEIVYILFERTYWYNKPVWGRQDEGASALFRAISSLPRLERLDFSGMPGDIREEYLQAICKCKSLDTLGLGDISQADPACLANLSRLENLIVVDCRLEIFHALAKLPRFRRLYVRRPDAFSGEVSKDVAGSIAQLDGRLKSYGNPLGRSVHPSLVRAMSKVKSLETLEIEDVDPPLTLEDVAAVAELPNLMIFAEFWQVKGAAEQMTDQERERLKELHQSITERIRTNRKRRLRGSDGS